MTVETSRCITYGRRSIEFELIRSNRQTLDISVQPNQQVTVKAPVNALLEEIDRRVKNHARWILKQQHYFSQFEPRTPLRQYASGETHLYLGRQYRLKVRQSTYTSVKLKGRYITIDTPYPGDSELVQDLLDRWYLERARIKFKERLDFCFTPFQRMGHDRPAFQIRRLSKRWGSLTAKGSIVLNRDLIRASSRQIDYVITHELCHLQHPNHSPAFYNLLDRLMPDWKERKLRLEQMLA